MKKMFLLLLLLSTFSYSQNRIINLQDPIAEIDISFSEEGIARLFVILNTVESAEESIGDNSYTADINVQGLIHWEDAQKESRKNILKNVPLMKVGSETPFVLFTDLYSGENKFLKKPDATNKWKKISLKLSYVINGKTGQTPTLNLYPPKDNAGPIKREIQISAGAIQKESRKGIIHLKSVPSGMPFEITTLKIRQINGGEEQITVLGRNELGEGRFSYNGELKLSVPTGFDIETLNSKYVISCTAGLLAEPNTLLETNETEVIFVPDLDLKILNRNPGYSITLPSDASTHIDKNLETLGNGKLGIRFLDPRYQHIRTSISPLGNGKYNIFFEGLESIPIETSSTFFYTNGTTDISPPLVISKKLPRISDFKFDGVKENHVALSFRLPGIENGIHPGISLSGSKGTLDLGGNVVIRKINVAGADGKYEVLIDRNISDKIIDNKVVEDMSIAVNYGGNILYNLTVTVYNQSYYDGKRAELTQEANKKKKDRDPEKIENLVKEISAIGIALGNTIDEAVVQETIGNLRSAKGDKVKAVMSDVGKWTLIAGKIVLPLLAI